MIADLTAALFMAVVIATAVLIPVLLVVAAVRMRRDHRRYYEHPVRKDGRNA